jgi:hypothetical protein
MKHKYIKAIILFLFLPFIAFSQDFFRENIERDLQKAKFSKSSFQYEASTFTSKKVKHQLEGTTPFIAISAVLQGANFSHDAVELFVFATPDGETKNRWIALEHDHHNEQTDNQLSFPPIYLSSKTKHFRYKIIRNKKEVELSKITLQLFVPANVHPVENNALDVEESAGRACSCSQPASVGRASWGSSYGLTANSSCSSPSYTTVTHLIVHHAAGSNTSTNWAAVVASIWNYHVNSNGWCDVGYNWLIDPNGVLYVGRGGGNNVVGAHMCGYNQKTMGVCMLGDYNTATPSTAAMNKLAEIFAWKCCNAGIDPLGSGPITSYPGTMNNISGHKQGCSPGYTDCPGTNLFSQLSNLRTAVNNYINNGCSTTTPTNPINDYCSGAIDLTSSTTCTYQTYSNTNATGSIAATSPCNGFTNGNADDDVWFKFTAVATQHSVRLLNGSSFDGVVDVRSGTCNSSTSIGCDDQTGSTGILNSVTLTNLTIGTTYFVRVYHYGTGSGGGSFQVCVTHPQPTCAQPTGRATSGITPTTASLSWTAVFGVNNYEVWYKVSGASTYTKQATTGTSLALSNLTCNTSYEWSVMAYCTNGLNSGTPSVFSTFTTSNDLPNATINHTTNGYVVSFTATPTGNPTTYSWNFGDGSQNSSQQNPSHTYPSSGVSTSYTVTLSLTNYCGSRNVTYTFTLTPNCVFNLSANSAAIDSAQQSVSVNLTNAANCSWTSSSNCNFVSISPSSGSGNETISIAVAENIDTASRTCFITIAGKTFTVSQSGKIAPVNCSFNLSSNSTTIDSNQQTVNVQLTNSANCSWTSFANCNFVTVSPSSGSSNSNIAIDVAANPDTISRSCTVTIAGKTFTITQGGKIPPVICVFTISTDSILVDSSQQNVSVQLSNAVGCAWSVVSTCNFIALNPQSGTASQSINIAVNANNDTLPRKCNFQIAGKNVVVIQSGKTPPQIPPCTPPLQEPPIVANGCNLASTPVITNVVYTWYKNGDSIPGVNARFFTVEDDKGYYSVMISDNNNCTAVSTDLYVDCTLPPQGINDLKHIKNISIVPNPASQTVLVNIESDMVFDKQIMLHNTLGQLITTTSTLENSTRLDVRLLAEGIYYLSVQSLGEVVVKKLIVERR